MRKEFYSRFGEKISVDFDDAGLTWLYTKQLTSGVTDSKMGRINLPSEAAKEVEDLLAVIEEFDLPF